MPFTIQRSFYDPSRDHGLWSPSTSAANFCEEDWQIYYVAEFINTISNLAYIYFALRPTSDILPRRAYSNAKNSTTSRSSESAKRGVIWDFHTISLILVGLTSGVFHATLRAFPQWLDETSMYLLAGSFAWSVLSTKYVVSDSKGSNHKDHPRKRQVISHYDQRLVALSLVALLSLTSLVSMRTGNPDIHSIMFAVIIVGSGVRLIYLIFTFQPESPLDGKTTFLGFTVTVAQRRMLISLVKADMLLNLAFTLWLIDCNPTCCGYLRHFRNEILGTSWLLRPLGELTELHGWWHFLTAAAAGEYIGLLRLLTTEEGS